MTTVVYRDGVLAADRQVTMGVTHVGKMRKVYRRPDGALIGGRGDTSLLVKFFDWFMAGEQGYRPRLKSAYADGDDAETQLIIVRPNGSVELHDSLGYTPIQKGKFFAIGSGAEVAYGALEMGATAVQAVRAAAKHDIHTGGGVHQVTL